jgi:sporulation protein YlmC with PRC-barrel domain
MKASDLKGMTVVSIADGLRLGTVHELLLDADGRQLAAVVVQPGPGTSTRLIPRDAIKHVGADAITVENVQAARPKSDGHPRAPMPALGSILGLKVVDTAGSLLGTVAEMELNSDDGCITSVLVHHGGVLGVGGSTNALPAAAIRSLGPELVMVEPVAEPRAAG